MHHIVEHHTFMGYSYTLTRKKMKRVILRVQPDGKITISCPRHCKISQIEQFLSAQSTWIAQQLSNCKNAQEPQDIVPVPISKEDALLLFTHVSKKFFPYFDEALHGMCPLLKVRNLKATWGICHMQKQYITFNLRLATQPYPAIEYVVVHEFAHFIEPNHSKAFWRIVEDILPDYKARKALLK